MYANCGTYVSMYSKIQELYTIKKVLLLTLTHEETTITS